MAGACGVGARVGGHTGPRARQLDRQRVALARSMHRLALGDGPGAGSWARKALALEPDVGFAEHATASYFLGIALFYSGPDEAEPLLRNYLAVVPSGEHDVRRYYAMALLAEHHAIRGEVDAAEQLARKALQVALANGLEEHPPTEQVHVALGATHLARGRLELAEEEVLQRAVSLARRGGDRVEHAHALAWLARVRSAQRDPTGARDALQRARELVPDAGRSILQIPVHAVEQQLDQPTRPRATNQSDQPLTDAELRGPAPAPKRPQLPGDRCRTIPLAQHGPHAHKTPAHQTGRHQPRLKPSPEREN